MSVFVSGVFATTAVEWHGNLSVSGSKIVDKRGDTVCFAGPSLFWSNTGWGGDKFYNGLVVTEVAKEWEAPIIRASMGVDAAGGYLSNPENKTRIEEVIDAAIEEGIYVIVDWHSHHAEDYETDAKNFFKAIAQKYGKYPNIIYEVYNEPLDVSWSEVIKPYATSVIKTIRQYDSDNIIIVGNRKWSQMVDEPADDPITGYNNIAYTCHFYAGTHTQWLRDKINYAISKDICIVITEWGTVDADGNGAVATAEVALWVDFMKENKITNCNWALNDKTEGASMLKPGAGEYGFWLDSDFTESGLYVYDLIKNWDGNWVSIESVLPDSPVYIYQNSEGNIIIHSDIQTDALYKIYDVSGRLIDFETTSNGIIQTAQIKAGLYALIIEINKETYRFKFINK